MYSTATSILPGFESEPSAFERFDFQSFEFILEPPAGPVDGTKHLHLGFPSRRKWLIPQLVPASRQLIAGSSVRGYPCAGSVCAEVGIFLPKWRHVVCRLMIILLPASLAAQDPTRGLLHSDGGTWLNEAPAPNVAAIFPDSLVQTQAGHVARIEVEGSSVTVLPETMMQFQGLELALDHGTLQVDTAREMEVIVGCVRISPVNSERTQFDVTDAGGRVTISVSKNDVKIHSHGAELQKTKGIPSDAVLHPGEHATRVDHCGSSTRTQAPGVPGLLDSPAAAIAGAGIAGALICLGVCHGDDPVSPTIP
jgi:hypothetical protein